MITQVIAHVHLLDVAVLLLGLDEAVLKEVVKVFLEKHLKLESYPKTQHETTVTAPKCACGEHSFNVTP